MKLKDLIVLPLHKMLLQILLAKQPPVVLMHGMTFDAESMELMASLLKAEIPGLYTKSCEVGNGAVSSVLMPMRKQIDELALCIADDPNLEDGFIGLAFSQGGVVMRGYLEYYSHVYAPMLRFITLSSPIGGFFCGRKSKCGSFNLPGFLNNLAADLIYSDFVQGFLSAAGYWRDPYNLDKYQENCDVLPELDNIRNYDEQRRQNYLSIDKHIMFGSEKDGQITPWQSAWFGVWADNNDSLVLNMEQRPEYQADLFGLKTMNDEGRLVTINSGLYHTDYPTNQTWIKENLPQWIKMDV